MDEAGFSIRCPNCFDWSDWPDHPSRFAISGIEEWKEIVHGICECPQGYSHEKMLSCQNGGGGKCPSPFQVLISEDPASAHWYVQDIPTWMVSRAFRLFHSNRRTRWDDYGAILFCTHPVPRLKHIELERLIDRQLLSRSILGMSHELKAPVTLYAAHVCDSDPRKRTFWFPVEAHTTQMSEIPPRYNALCDACRQAALEVIRESFPHSPSPSACPLGFPEVGACSTHTAPCTHKDWSHCPAFLEARNTFCPCYQSDGSLIADLESLWRNAKLPSDGSIERACWAGLQELAAPVVVHDHLVGVLVTGQFVTKATTLPDLETLISARPYLARRRKDLQFALDLLDGTRAPVAAEDHYTVSFRRSDQDMKNARTTLVTNARRISDVATTTYRTIRFRSEAVFKQELLYSIEGERSCGTPIKDVVLALLNRMRAFWAFTGVYLLSCPLETKEASVVGYSRIGVASRFFQFPGKVLGTVEENLKQVHPLPFLYDRAVDNTPPNAWLKSLRELFKRALADPELCIPVVGRCYYFVCIPYFDHIYAFVFAMRDDNAVSPLRPLENGGVSELCQDVILDTCTSITRRLGESWYQSATEHRLRMDAWRSLSGRVAHRLRSELGLAMGAIRGLQRQYGANADLDELRLSVRRLGHIAGEFRDFTRNKLPNLKNVDARVLLEAIVSEYQKRLGRRSLEVLVDGEGPFVVACDPDQIRQVLGELLLNARKHTKAGDQIRVGLRSSSIAGRQGVCWSVQNAGTGISPEDKEKVFLPFFGRDHRGSGLGLAIAKQIVVNHEGEIVEDGEPGIMARFVVTIPLQPPE